LSDFYFAGGLVIFGLPATSSLTGAASADLSIALIL
jgi:hypothetical protein